MIALIVKINILTENLLSTQIQKAKRKIKKDSSLARVTCETSRSTRGWSGVFFSGFVAPPYD